MLNTISQETGFRKNQVAAVAELMEQGGTIPFIARYRKEQTGSLDEVAITAIRDGLARLRALEDRKETILKSLETRQLLTPDLKGAISEASTSAQLEDIYHKVFRKKEKRLELLCHVTVWLMKEGI
ncbi:MAG: Tex-like N-terminal domain-containing protein, partial [Desulfobacterium sp.]